MKIYNNLRKKKGLVADFFWGEILQLANKRKGSCDKYKGFFLEKNGPLLSHYEEKNLEVIIFRQQAGACHKNIASFLKFSTLLSDL